MKVRIQLEPSEAASAAQAFVERGPMVGKLAAAVRAVARALAAEEGATDQIVSFLQSLSESDAIDFDVEAAESDEGDTLLFALEGEIDFELEALLDTRRAAKVFGNLLLDVIALSARLELTTVQVKIGGRRSSLEALSDAIVRHAGELSVFLIPARERSVEGAIGAVGDDDLEDEDDDDQHDDEDDDLDDDDLEDEEDDDLEDDEDADEDGAEGIPPGGWGARRSAPRHPQLSPDELFYLEVTQLSWPCTSDAVRSSLRRAAHYHPDLVQHDPALRAVRHEQFARLTQAHTALLARLRREVR